MDRRRILVLVSVRGGYYRNIIRGIYRFAAACGGWTLQQVDPGSLSEPPNVQNIDGVIYCASNSKVNVRDLALLGKPVVDSSNWVSTPGVVSITSDDDAAGVCAAEHLLGLGHTHFAFAGLPVGLYSKLRGEGFVRRLARERLHVEQFTLYEGHHVDGVWVNQIERTKQWLLGLPKPCALLVCADQDALHVWQIANAAGIAIPDDLAIMAVDDDDLVCGLAEPALTSVRMDGVGVGLAAAQALDRQLTTGIPHPSRRLLPLGVTVRRSTDGKPIADPVVRMAVSWLRLRAAGEAPLAECARATGVSLRTLQLRFATVLGVGPAEILLKLRLEHAARLLAETDLPLKAVAPRSGFASAAYLCTAFFRDRGMTPGTWRAKHQPQAAVEAGESEPEGSAPSISAVPKVPISRK